MMRRTTTGLAALALRLADASVSFNLRQSEPWIGIAFKLPLHAGRNIFSYYDFYAQGTRH